MASFFQKSFLNCIILLHPLSHVFLFYWQGPLFFPHSHLWQPPLITKKCYEYVAVIQFVYALGQSKETYKLWLTSTFWKLFHACLNFKEKLLNGLVDRSWSARGTCHVRRFSWPLWRIEIIPARACKICGNFKQKHL